MYITFLCNKTPFNFTEKNEASNKDNYYDWLDCDSKRICKY